MSHDDTATTTEAAATGSRSELLPVEEIRARFPAVDRLGLGGQGLVRAGCACYTTDGEIDRLVEALAEVAT